MSTPLELYREWELSQNRRTCHVVIIDRGDNSAANRLTLTDHPYVDKGVGGTRYHHTYPAPIHCITSNIKYTSTRTSTTFEDLVLVSESGLLDTLMDESIVGKTVTCMKGDASWSILETDFPYRFLPFYIAEVDGVSVDPDGAWRISLREKKYSLDSLVGSINSPIAIGIADNVPSVLVDDATHRYRFSGYELSDLYTSHEYRDNGAPLASPTDYTEITESGVFKGLIELASAPSGELTATVYGKGTYYLDSIQWVISNFVRPSSSLYDSEYDYTADSEIDSPYCDSIGFSADESVMIAVDQGTKTSVEVYARKYTITSGEVSALSLVSSYDMGAFIESKNAAWINKRIYDVALSPDGTTLFCLTDAGYLVAVALDTAFDITDTNAGSTVAQSVGPASTIPSFDISEDGESLYLLNDEGVVSQYSFSTAFLVTSMSWSPDYTLDLGYLYSPQSVEIKNSGKYLYVGAAKEVHQFELTQAWSIEEAYNPQRLYLLSLASEGASRFRVSDDLSKFYSVSLAIKQYNFPNADGDLPLATYLDNFSVNFLYSYLHYGPMNLFYNAPTSCSSIIADLVETTLSEYTVDHLGILYASQMKNVDSYVPESWETVFTASLGDFIGDRGTHIKHVEFLEPVKRVTLTYDHNYAVQSEGTIAGSVSETLRSHFSTAKKYAESVSLIADPPGVVSRDLSFNTYLSAEAYAELVGEDYLSIYEVRRSLYEWTMPLNWQSLANDVRLGSIIEISGDIRHKEFSDGDLVIVDSREVDSTMNKQILTVFK